MAYPTFTLNRDFSPEGREIVILPFLDEETACFPDALIRWLPSPPRAPASKGGAKVVHASHGQDGDIVVRAVRLDAKLSTPQEALMKAVSSAVGECGEEFTEVVVMLSQDHFGLLPAVQEGAIIGGYRFDRYLSEHKPVPRVTAAVDSHPSKELAQKLEEREVIFRWVNFARDVLNEPPNVINPVSLSELMKKEGKRAGLKMTVWDDKRLEKERCGGVLAVGRGSEHPPRMVIGRYKGKGAKAAVTLVGKGITFDTGGYCLKPPSAQEGMKYDMSGAAAAFSAACALAALKAPVDLTVITPLAENAVSHKAFMTSDIVIIRCGKSVQVDNTDAEGRLILADALCLAAEQEPDFIIDVATLTGACVVALGEDIAGFFSNDDSLAQAIEAAGTASMERFWRLPLHRPYTEQLKTEIADLKNIGGKWGGAITAALFLQEFVPEDMKWAHLDIAGPAVKEEPLNHLGKGAKGFGVKTLVELSSRLGGGR